MKVMEENIDIKEITKIKDSSEGRILAISVS